MPFGEHLHKDVVEKPRDYAKLESPKSLFENSPGEGAGPARRRGPMG